MRLIADRQTLPAAVRRRQIRDHGQEAPEARRDERPLRRQRGDHQEAPGPVLQSHRAGHRLLREPRHRQEGWPNLTTSDRFHFRLRRTKAEIVLSLYLCLLRSTRSCQWTRSSAKSAKSLTRCSKTTKAGWAVSGVGCCCCFFSFFSFFLKSTFYF